MSDILKKNKKRFVLLLSLSFFDVSLAYADGWVLPDKPAGLLEDFDKGAINVINWLLGFSILLAIFAIIWGGLRYTAAAGNQNDAETAKRVMKYALIGLLVSGISYAFVNVIVKDIF